jgi:hypothetical protein
MPQTQMACAICLYNPAMPAKKPKPKKKPVAPAKPEQYPAAFMDAVRKAVSTPKPKGGWPKPGK